MRRIGLVVLLCPGLAGADIRLDLEPMPELLSLEPAFHLDRGESARSKSGILGSIGLGYGRFDDADEATAVGALAIGMKTSRVLAVASSELVVAGDQVWRGHHRGLVELRTAERSNDGIRGSLALQTAIDHGEARALAPVRLGQGRYDTGDVTGEALLHLGKDKDDFVVVGELFGSVGATQWHDAGLDRATRRSVGLGIGLTPDDGELPRGTIDLVRGRVERVSIRRPIAATGEAIGTTEVSIVELGLGPHELTLHIDHELLAVINADLGWTWLESKSIDDNMFRMRLGTGLKWQTDRSGGVRRLGLAVAREPGYTPDGQRLVADWRTELAYGVEDTRYLIEASGGISWLRAIEGGNAQPMTARYASHLEAFVKIRNGIEVGGYHAASFENQLAGDPWAASRRWGTEAGVLVRWRNGQVKKRVLRFECGHVPTPEPPPLEPEYSHPPKIAIDPEEPVTPVEPDEPVTPVDSDPLESPQ
ncbi:MAG: hypothetical protein ABI867_21795 [Kofleriaceae bacterium]